MARHVAVERWLVAVSSPWVLPVSVLMTFAAAAHAAPDSSVVAVPDTTHVTEVRVVRASSPISLDGSLGDAAWQSAPAIGGFKQRDPNEGSAPSQQTEVRLLY